MSAFELIGGARPLDFVNTVSWGDGAEERLRTYDDFLAWCRAAGVPVGKGRNARVLRKALQLRATLHRVFLTRRGEADFDAFLAPALRQLIVRRGKWTLREPSHPDAPLWWIAWEAANLMTSDAMVNVRRCSNDNCLWLFIDESRRHNRRWCEMRVCGSRAKARAFYARRRDRLSSRA